MRIFGFIFIFILGVISIISDKIDLLILILISGIWVETVWVKIVKETNDDNR